ncbi:YfiM family protein [Archangium sp.]|jgi:putative lipoprotein|uniref:YfiM family protein n=1 Tax=Archangium sp. TaxID=1872627 RepID=UPI00389A31A0
MTERETLLALLCLSLLAPLSARGEVTEIPSRDDWFGPDKALHFSVSAGLAGVGYAGGALLFEAPEARWLTGAGVALGAGVAKELYDAGRGSFFSAKDLTWDVLGTATGLGLSWAVDRLFFSRGDVAWTPASRGGGAGLPGGPRPTLALRLNASGHPQGTPGSGRNVPFVLLLSGGW